MSEDWPDGSEFVYQGDITNGAGGAGDQTDLLVPGVGNEIEIYSIVVLNGDGSARTVTVVVETDTAGEEVNRPVAAQSVNAGSREPVPNARLGHGQGRLILSGGMRLLITIAAVALSEDTAVGINGRIKGGVPTITESGASTPTINVNTEKTI